MPSVYLEIVYAIWVGIGLVLISILARYLFVALQDDGWDAAQAQLAKGLLVYFVGDTMLRSWVWWARAGLRDGNDTTWMFGAQWIFAFALIAVVGALCVCRVLLPNRWGHWRWLVPGATACAMVAWSLLGTQR